MRFPIKPTGWKPGDTAAKDGCRYGGSARMRPDKVHQGGFRPQANKRANHRLNDKLGAYGITYAAN
jgi:hypothetical protein